MRSNRALIVVLSALFVLVPSALAQETSRPTVNEMMSEAQMLTQSRKWDEAAEKWGAITELVPSDPNAAFQHAYALHMGKQFDEAIPAHKKAAEFDAIRPVALYNLACAYALTGETDQALTALEDSIDAGFIDMTVVEGDTDLDPIRDDARFKQALKRIGSAPLPPQYRQLLFWVGEWDVYNADDQLVGHNTLTLADNGFAIHESWRSSTGSTGHSINYYHPTTGQWNQLWVSAAGDVLDMSGTFSDGAMRLTGTRVDRNGREFQHRTTLTPLDGGRVRQHIEESSDGGATWKVGFDAVYVPEGSPAPEGWADELEG